MTADNIEILKRIKEKESESEERLKKANDEAKKIIDSATVQAAQIVKDAEENARKLYDEFVRKEMDKLEVELIALRKKFDDEISKLNKQIQEKAIQEMMNVLLE